MNHVRVYKLDDKRDWSTLAVVKKIVQRVDPDQIDANDPKVLVPLLKLHAELQGEAKSKLEVEVGGEVTLNVLEQLRHNLKQRVGDTDDEETET